jgi:hypothetical protein
MEIFFFGLFRFLEFLFRTVPINLSVEFYVNCCSAANMSSRRSLCVRDATMLFLKNTVSSEWRTIELATTIMHTTTALTILPMRCLGRGPARLLQRF